MGAEISTQQVPPVSSSWSHRDTSFAAQNRRLEDGDEELVGRKRPALTQSASLDFVIAQKEDGVILEPAQSKVSEAAAKMNTIHFSDFSLFPDRFATKKNVEKGRDGGEALSEGVAPKGVPIPAIKVSKSSEPVGSYSHQGSNISKYNVRLRTFSGSETEDEIGRPRSNSTNTYPEELTGLSPPRGGQRRPSGTYFFDFSLIPEKDPHFDARQRRVRMSSQGDDGPPLPVTTPATTPTTPLSPVSAPEEPVFPPKAKTRERKVSEHTYSFFDYSMIPDKMDRRNSGEETRLKLANK